MIRFRPAGAVGGGRQRRWALARRPPAAILIIAVVLLAASCGTREDPARAALRTRLTDSRHLTADEVRQFLDEIARAIGDRHVRVKQAAITRALNERESAAVLGMLSEPAAVYDAGLRRDGDKAFRGLSAGGTPALSEVEAVQTLWVDVASFTPSRYEFTYGMPGLGDYSYELVVE